MTYGEALAWLNGVQRFGIKLGLENARRLFTALDVTNLEARIIHVAGTNGKGSTCAMAAAICQAQGYRTALFTSPHLITFRERIRVNGEMISEADVAEGLSAIRDRISAWEPHPTFFEITTALALRHFKQQHCEIVVLETGMGGRLDATNVIQPAVCAITPVDFDHQQWLGTTLEQIAGEKAGIIKPRVPVVSAKQAPEVERVIRKRAAECDAPLRFVDAEQTVALAGPHQRRNAALALAALHGGKIEVDEAAIATGLATVEWAARFQRVGEQLVIDGAHNPAGARVLVETWRNEFGSTRPTIVAGMLRDKDSAPFWRTLSAIAADVILSPFRSDRAMPATELRDVIQQVAPDLNVTIAPAMGDAITMARDSGRAVLITGSLHFAGEALATLAGETRAFEECSQ